MNEFTTSEKETIIQYILKNNPKIQRPQLEHLSVVSLLLIKVQTEIELMKKLN